MLDSNKVITIPHDICQFENLSSSQVQMQHLDRLRKHENNFKLKLAFRLKNDDLHCRNQYKKNESFHCASCFQSKN